MDTVAPLRRGRAALSARTAASSIAWVVVKLIVLRPRAGRALHRRMRAGRVPEQERISVKHAGRRQHLVMPSMGHHATQS